MALLLLTARGISCLEDVTVHPAEFPFDPTQSHDGYSEWKINILADKRGEGEGFCYTPMDRFKDFESRKKEEERSLAQYYYGRRLACAYHKEDHRRMSTQQRDQLWEKREPERLQGLALMHSAGALKPLYPEEGQSLNSHFSHYYKYHIANTIYTRHYYIDGCYYFTLGTLLCPDESTSTKLKSRLEALWPVRSFSIKMSFPH